MTLRAWEDEGEKVVCLRCESLQELQQLHATAAGSGLPAYLVCDAGRTEVDAGSATVVAIGPAPEDLVDSITGHLRLY